MASLRDIVSEMLGDAAHKVDEGAVRSLYAAVSVPAERERERLRRTHRPFCDPKAEGVDPAAVSQTADHVIEQAAAGATALGGFAGLGGLASVPPEILASMVTVVRLAQRLAVVYGFDPETDRGQMALQQALSAGLQVELPVGGPLGLKVSDLPRVFAPRMPTDVSVAMTRALVRQTAWMVVGSLGRFVPVLSAGFGAVGGRRRTRAVGQRMKEALARLSDLPLDQRAGIVDAIEV